MSIRAFVFDCGGVILCNGDMAPYARWGRRVGVTPEELSECLWRGEAWDLAERGQLSDGEFWQRVGGELGLADPKEIAALSEEIWTTWVVNARVLALADRARARHKVAILSNATDGLEDQLRVRYGIAGRFDAIISSADVGIAKPEPAIYEEMLRRLEVAPKEVVFVDDRAENIAAAAALGMHVAWFVNDAELERQLEVYLSGNGERFG